MIIFPVRFGKLRQSGEIFVIVSVWDDIQMLQIEVCDRTVKMIEGLAINRYKVIKV